MSDTSSSYMHTMTIAFTWIGLGSAKGKSASMGTTQGEMVVPKFFPRKGPRGTYSHAWISLAENEHKLTVKMTQTLSLCLLSY